MKTRLLSLFILIMGVSGIFAQETAQTGSLIQGGIADGNKLIRAYIAPLNKDIIYSMGAFDYNGFAHGDDKKLSVGIKTLFLISPQSDRTYHVNELGLETLEAEDPQNDVAQTVFGDTIHYVKIVSKKKDLLGRPLFSFNSPTGSGYPGFPIPYIDVNFKWKNFNFNGGLIPLVPVPTTDLNIFMFKGGVQYNLASMVGFVDEEKAEWSVGGSIGYFHGYSDLDVQPDGVTIDAGTITGSHNGPYDNQQLLLDFYSFSLSTHYAYFLNKHWRVFGGIGFVAGQSSLKLVGKYPIYTSDPTGSVSVVAEDVEDPLDIQDTYSQPFAEAGIRGDWKHFYVQLQGNLGIYSGGGLTVGYKIF